MIMENKMSDYLYNHNYISETKKYNKQKELSTERAEAIVNKHQNIINDEFKELLNYRKAFKELKEKYEKIFSQAKSVDEFTILGMCGIPEVLSNIDVLEQKYNLGGN